MSLEIQKLLIYSFLSLIFLFLPPQLEVAIIPLFKASYMLFLKGGMESVMIPL